jgi:uncharacterized repeat protein (TIGR03803 family)
MFIGGTVFCDRRFALCRSLVVSVFVGLFVSELVAPPVWAAQAASESILASFNDPVLHNGSNPVGSLLQASDGSLYGTTTTGGTNNLGTVFKIDSGGTLTTLHSFGSSTTDGSNPNGSLIQLTSTGLLYGTTKLGGGGDSPGGGTIFSISTAGSETIVYSFPLVGTGFTDGSNPYAGLLASQDETTLYGTTSNGGANYLGTVFSITPTGQENWLYSFCSSNDGVQPLAPVIDGGDGYLYGTTSGGGAAGTVFKIPYAGAQPCSDVILLKGPSGDFNYGTSAALLLGTDGNFYGVTQGSGYGPNGGVLFELTKDGIVSVLHTFGYGTNDPDGSNPSYATIQGADGTLYGTTNTGGANGQGTLYSFANGTFSTLYSFGASNTDGANPNGIILGSDGAIYGTTANGGTVGLGTIFKITLSDASSPISSSKSGGGGAIGLFSLLWLSLYLIVRLRGVFGRAQTSHGANSISG